MTTDVPIVLNYTPVFYNNMPTESRKPHIFMSRLRSTYLRNTTQKFVFLRPSGQNLAEYLQNKYMF